MSTFQPEKHVAVDNFCRRNSTGKTVRSSLGPKQFGDFVIDMHLLNCLVCIAEFELK